MIRFLISSTARWTTRFLLLFVLLYPMAVASFAQGQRAVTRSVSGTIVDNDGVPVAGANVLVRGTRIGVVSDGNGSFTLQNVPSNATIQIFFLGFKDWEQPLNGRTALKVQLEPDAAMLDEVVVIPYGDAVARRDLTGSVASVNMQDMKKLTTTTFENAIAGKVAGVQVNMGDGQPGGLPDIVIRGYNSVTQSNSPLYVVDGIPLEEPDNSSIPMTNIKSIEVLKDASATAIYGARGANGVIVITTDTGAKGAPKVSFDVKYSIMKDYNGPKMMDPYEFVRLTNELDSSYGAMYLGNRLHENGAPWTLEDYRDVEGIDWWDMVSRTGQMKEYGVSMSGGTDQTTYQTSFNYTDQDGIILNTDYKNYVGSINMTQKIGSKLTLTLRANYAHKVRSGINVASGQGSGAYMYKVWTFRPLDVTGVDLTREFLDPLAQESGLVRFNPYLTTLNTDQQYYTTQLRTSAQLSWAITPWLKFNTSISLTKTGSKTDIFNNSRTESGALTPGHNDGINGSRRTSDVSNLLNENMLNFHKKFANAHDVSFTIGATQQKNRNDIFEVKATQIPETSQWRGIQALDEGAVYTIVSKKLLEWSLQSFLARANYNYRNKYYVTGTVRADGSSKFSAANRWGVFYSGALRWRFTEEKPIKNNLKWLNDGSLSVSYGSTGNNGVGEYSWQALAAASSGSTYYDYSFNNQYPSTGAIVQSIGNSDLKWETTYTFNTRLDLGFFDSRIYFTGEYYWKDTRDLLINATLPAHIGYPTAYRNIGRVENRGLEFTLTTRNISSPNFRWSTDFNISFNRNKVLELSNDQSVLPSDLKYTNGNSNSVYIAKVGYPIGMIYGALTDGLYQLSDFNYGANGNYILKDGIVSQSTIANRTGVMPGFQKYVDMNNDKQITVDDLTIIGNPNPDFVGGLTNNFDYRNFDLSVFFTFSYGNDILNMNRVYLEEGRSTSTNQYATFADRWTMDNQNGLYPRVKSSNNVSWISDRFVEDGSYLRLRNVNLGYSLPVNLTKKLYISRIRVYFSAQNLWTLTKYSGQDPTVSVSSSARTPGYDYSAYPIPRTFVFGAQVSF